MKKIAVAAIAAMAFVIVFSGCDFNLFEAIDTVEVPSAQALIDKASSNAAGFVDDVYDYIDSGAVTEDNADDIVAALEDVYTDQPDTQTGQEAAILAGEISITSDPNTEQLVENVVSALVDIDSDTSSEELLGEIFPPDLTQEEFSAILDNLDTAAAAYEAFADSIDSDGDGAVDPGEAEWLDSGDAGSVVQYAVVAIVASEIRGLADSDQAIYDYIYNGSATIDGYDESTDDALDVDALKVILDLVDISI